MNQDKSTGAIVVVGAGQAGVQLATALREGGFGGRLVLLGEEPSTPYQRPPLSKSFLLGKLPVESIQLRPPEFYRERDIAFRPGHRVRSLDRTQRRVELVSGEAISYDHLVLATGARNRALELDGSELDGVVQLRSLEDAQHIRSLLGDVRRAIVVGAGFIGLEFAAVAATLNIETHIFEVAARPLARVTSEPTSSSIARAHQAWGNRLHVHSKLQRIVGERGRVVGVVTNTGEHIAADLVLVGIGVRPNDELAHAAGLGVDDGVLVDDQLHTMDRAISAIGDCARFVGERGFRMRIESVQNASDQARTLASTLLGKSSVYRAVPWFWSDQQDIKLQLAGLSAGYDQTVVLGETGSRRFSVCCFRERELIAVESVNQPLEHMLARKLLARKCALTPEEAAGEGFDLKTYELATRPNARSATRVLPYRD